MMEIQKVKTAFIEFFGQRPEIGYPYARLNIGNYQVVLIYQQGQYMGMLFWHPLNHGDNDPIQVGNPCDNPSGAIRSVLEKEYKVCKDIIDTLMRKIT